MIIFDLDGTLADCEHRRHFVDPTKNPEYFHMQADGMTRVSVGYFKPREGSSGFIKFQPDWKSFHEACSQDKPIIPSWHIFNCMAQWCDVQIWSGRCESVRDKTIHWLMNRCPLKPTYWNEESWNHVLKMRPIGDSTPDDQLKEKWLNERCSDLITAKMEGKNTVKHDIQFVFDDRPKVVRMWRRRGIFVFNCCQHDIEF